MPCTFSAYIDESGDEGFAFRANGNPGSSTWFVLSAVVIRSANEPLTRPVMETLRQALGKPERAVVHFVDLRSHNKRVLAAQHVGTAERIRTATVLCHKPLLVESGLVGRQRLYHYATRYLLERVSWLCRDNVREDDGRDGTCRLVFSNRSNTRYDELRDYLDRLRGIEDCRIEWAHIDPSTRGVITLSHPQSWGLQMADVVASSYFQALEADRLGVTESRYARELVGRAYRYKDRCMAYGLKFMPAGGVEQVRQLRGSEWLAQEETLREYFPA